MPAQRTVEVVVDDEVVDSCGADGGGQRGEARVHTLRGGSGVEGLRVEGSLM